MLKIRHYKWRLPFHSSHFSSIPSNLNPLTQLFFGNPTPHKNHAPVVSTDCSIFDTPVEETLAKQKFNRRGALHILNSTKQFRSTDVYTFQSMVEFKHRLYYLTKGSRGIASLNLLLPFNLIEKSLEIPELENFSKLLIARILITGSISLTSEDLYDIYLNFQKIKNIDDYIIYIFIKSQNYPLEDRSHYLLSTFEDFGEFDIGQYKEEICRKQEILTCRYILQDNQPFFAPFKKNIAVLSIWVCHVLFSFDNFLKLHNIIYVENSDNKIDDVNNKTHSNQDTDSDNTTTDKDDVIQTNAMKPEISLIFPDHINVNKIDKLISRDQRRFVNKASVSPIFYSHLFPRIFKKLNINIGQSKRVSIPLELLEILNIFIAHFSLCPEGVVNVNEIDEIIESILNMPKIDFPEDVRISFATISPRVEKFILFLFKKSEVKFVDDETRSLLEFLKLYRNHS